VNLHTKVDKPFIKSKSPRRAGFCYHMGPIGGGFDLEHTWVLYLSKILKPDISLISILGSIDLDQVHIHELWDEQQSQHQ